MLVRKLALWFVLVFLVVGLPALAFAQGALPDVSDPAASGSFVWKMYKAGHLVPAIIVALFYALTFAEKRIAWLRTGYRKLYVATLLAALGELAERVASGTSPNTGMLLGTLGVAYAMWMKTHGEPKSTEPAKA